MKNTKLAKEWFDRLPEKSKEDLASNYPELVLSTERHYSQLGDIEIANLYNGVDLFQYYEGLPDEVQDVLLTWDDSETDTWGQAERIIKELNKLGYNAEYAMSGELYDLKTI